MSPPRKKRELPQKPREASQKLVRTPKLRVGKGLRLRLGEGGKLFCSVSASSGEFFLAPEILELLSLIAAGESQPELLARGLRARVRQLAETLPDADEISGLLADLRAARVLAGTDALEGGLEDGFGDPWAQWTMLADERRSVVLLEAVARALRPGDVVVDVGSGSGLLGLFALARGARKVVAIEETASVTLLRANAKSMGTDLSSRLEVQACNSFDAKLPPDATLVVSELFGNDPFQEGVLSTLADLGRRLPHGCRYLPERVEVHLSLFDLVDGPLLPRVGRLQSALSSGRKAPRASATKQASPDAVPFLAEFQRLARERLGVPPLSFDVSVRATDLRPLKASQKLLDLSLSPPVPAECGKRAKIKLRLPGGVACPVALLWYRVQVCEGLTLSNHPGAADQGEHWSPIVVPFDRALPEGSLVEGEAWIDPAESRMRLELYCGDVRIAER